MFEPFPLDRAQFHDWFIDAPHVRSVENPKDVAFLCARKRTEPLPWDEPFVAQMQKQP